MAQDNDGEPDELLRIAILAVISRAEKPLDAEELAKRIVRMLGVPPPPERGN